MLTPIPVIKKASDCMSISTRIREAREQSQMEPVALRQQLAARGITLSKTGLHRLENVEPTNPNLKLIEAVAEITHVSPTWLLFGKGTRLSPEEMGSAIRARVIDTIELMVGALDLSSAQDKTINAWLKSVRASRPKKVQRP